MGKNKMGDLCLLVVGVWNSAVVQNKKSGCASPRASGGRGGEPVYGVDLRRPVRAAEAAYAATAVNAVEPMAMMVLAAGNATRAASTVMVLAQEYSTHAASMVMVLAVVDSR